MQPARRIGILAVIVATAVVACAPPQLSRPATSDSAPPKQTAPSRVTAAILADPPLLIEKIEKTLPGSEALEALVSSGLAMLSGSGTLNPQLAEALPSTERGTWVVLPDGRMETTWKLRENVFWHDGTPFSAEDLVFTATVGQDPATPNFRHPGYRSIERVEAPDPRTVTVRWNAPFINADTLFSSSLNNSVYTAPLPRHLLEKAFLDDRTTLIDLPYWTEQFVGTGPYKLREWVRGSNVVLEANDRYVLGRPKIDVIDVKFIGDKNALTSNLLAGTVELTLGRGLSLDEAMSIGEQWRDGRVEFGILNWVAMYPQFINADPAVVTNVAFRRAVIHAIDRQEMVDVIQRGAVPVAHSYLSPGEAMYRDIESSIVRYDYDPRRSAQILEGLGYAKGADGFLRDASGQRLTVEIRTTDGNTVHRPALLSIADYLQRVGVGVDPVFVPPLRTTDREYVSTFPGFELLQHPNGVQDIARHHSRETALAENGFNRSGNQGRYMNAELDAHIDRFFATIPTAERTQIFGQIMHHVSDQLTRMGLFYQTEPALIGNRLENVGPKRQGSTPVWNVHEWTVRS